MTQKKRCRMPERLQTAAGEERRVGVEIELSGIGYQQLLMLCEKLLGGECKPISRYVSEIITDNGPFVIELDAAPIKELDLQDERMPQAIRDLGGQAMEVIDAAAEKIVPMEIVTPPLAFEQLPLVETLCDELRKAGALGSREAIYYAFGLQLNPELPDLEAATITRYLQGFAALYDWLKGRHQLDLSRKVTSYIEPWHPGYTNKLIAGDYNPDTTQLIRDYLQDNPTRNRALDLLPLFAHLDYGLLRTYVNDPRVKARPTLHYRLPDCDIDNPDWHFSTVWNDWVVLEQLVAHQEDLEALVAKFRDSRRLSFHNLTHSWPESCHEWLRLRGYV